MVKVILIAADVILGIAIIFFVLAGIAVVKKNISDMEGMVWRDLRS